MRIGFLSAMLVFGCEKGSHDEPKKSFVPKLHQPAVEPRAAPIRSSPTTPGTGDIGTASPMTLMGAAENGRWIAICQARADTDKDGAIHVGADLHGRLYGDEMKLYLVRGGGPGEEIDALLGESNSGQWLGIARKNALVVMNSERNEELAITDADVQGIRAHRGPTSLVFNDDESRAVYFRTTGTTTSVVIRDLAKGTERVVTLAQGKPWAVLPEQSGPWAQLLAVIDDTDHNGQLEFPVAHTNAPRDAPCSAEAISSSSWGASGDQPTRLWLRLDTGQVVYDPDLLRPVGDRMLVRAPDGAIRIDDQTIVPAACAAEVLAVFANPVRILALCQGAATAEGFGAGVRFKTPWERSTVDVQKARLLADPIICTPAHGCFDIRDGATFDLHGGNFVYRDKNHVLVDTYGILDLDTRRYTPLASVDSKAYPQAAAQSLVVVDGKLIDLAKHDIVGTGPGPVLALDRSGRMLVPTSTDPDSMVPMGPLRWTTATKH